MKFYKCKHLNKQALHIKRKMDMIYQDRFHFKPSMQYIEVWMNCQHEFEDHCTAFSMVGCAGGFSTFAFGLTPKFFIAQHLAYAKRKMWLWSISEYKDHCTAFSVAGCEGGCLVVRFRLWVIETFLALLLFGLFWPLLSNCWVLFFFTADICCTGIRLDLISGLPFTPSWLP